MNRHVEDTVLREFLAGTVDDGTAIEVALHIDACPTCASRADAMDPFLASLAAMADPMPPIDLVDAVLARADVVVEAAPVRAWWEIAVGGGLLAVAVVLAGTFGDPVAAAARIGRLVETLSVIGSNIALAGPVAVAILGFATVTLAFLSLEARVEAPVLERRTS